MITYRAPLINARIIARNFRLAKDASLSRTQLTNYNLAASEFHDFQLVLRGPIYAFVADMLLPIGFSVIIRHFRIVQMAKIRFG